MQLIVGFNLSSHSHCTSYIATQYISNYIINKHYIICWTKQLLLLSWNDTGQYNSYLNSLVFPSISQGVLSSLTKQTSNPVYTSEIYYQPIIINTKLKGGGVGGAGGDIAPHFFRFVNWED